MQLDSTYLKLRENPDFSLFVSKGLYVRQLQSPAPLCFTCSATQDSLNLIQEISRQLCSQWLTWIQQATPVSADFQEVLAQRDLQMRKISAERDPDNAMVTKIFGAELTNQLIQALWTPEPTSSHSSQASV